jgi:hypothetical protein
MSDLSFFEIFSECSIAFAGFGAVHAALAGEGGPRGDFRAFSVVSHGLLSFVLSIVPLLLALTLPPEEVLWRIASGCGLAGTMALFLSSLAFDSRMTRLGHPPQARLSIRQAQASLLLAALVMLGNLVGWPGTPAPFPYAVGLVFTLWAGMIALLHAFLRPIGLLVEGEVPKPPSGRPET